MGMKLPFYGIRGSIANIEEDKNSYQVATYDIEGKLNKFILNIKKTKKNENDLVSLFYTQMDEYLRFNKSKYDSLIKRGNKKYLDTKLVKLLLFISVLVGVMPIGIGIILANSILIDIGIVSFAVGAVSTTGSIIVLEKLKKHNSNVDFVRDYANFLHEYNVFVNSKDKNKTKKISRSLESSSHDLAKNKVFVKIKKTS